MTNARSGNAVHSAHVGFAHPKRNIIALGVEHAMRVADFGAGSGAYVLAMAEQLQNSGRIYAIDIQKDLLRRIHTEATKHGHKNVDVLWADLEIPGGSKLADKSLDLVLISNLLFQMDDKSVVIEEAKRIVKPGGRIAIIDWSESFGGLGPQRDAVVTKEAAYTLAKDAGLVFQKEFAAGAHHYGLVFRTGAGTRVTSDVERVQSEDRRPRTAEPRSSQSTRVTIRS